MALHVCRNLIWWFEGFQSKIVILYSIQPI